VLTPPLIHRVSAAVPLGVKREGREADYSPQSTVEVENGSDVRTFTPPYIFVI
jgi:hypothetical protein